MTQALGFGKRIIRSITFGRYGLKSSNIGEINILSKKTKGFISGKNYAIYTHCGGRSNNEDAAGCLRLSQHVQIFAVSDGMGGCSAGEEASHLAVNQYFTKRLEGMGAISAIYAANQEIIREASIDPNKKGMGATLAAVEIDSEKKCIEIYCVGDSRVKMVDQNTARLLTHDHSFKWIDFSKEKEHLNEFYKKLGQVSMPICGLPDEIIDKLDSHLMIVDGSVIYSSFGRDIRVIDNFSGTLEPTENTYTRLAIYSDGIITRANKESVLTQMLRKYRSASRASKAIVNRSINSMLPGEKDNATIVVVDIPYKLRPNLTGQRIEK